MLWAAFARAAGAGARAEQARQLSLAPALLTALRIHRERFGHVRVGHKFVVPATATANATAGGGEVAAAGEREGGHGPWPVACQGMALGRRTMRLRAERKSGALSAEEVAELDAVGFVWDLAEWRWERALSALRAFHAEEGDLSVPRRYVVPGEAPWPAEAWGLKLGVLVNNIRSEEQYVKGRPERRAELDELDFVWDAREWRWEHVLMALCGYGGVHGDLLVPQSFCVPAAAPWPEETWGLRLGACVNNIRGSERFVKTHPERREALDALGFVWNCQEWRWREVLAALRAYREAHGDLAVPRSFVVPARPPWPEATWGLKLGHRLVNIRASELYVRERPERRAALDELGMCWQLAPTSGGDAVAGGRVMDSEGWEGLMAALGVFKGQHGHMQVPLDFVVPPEPPWPESEWGTALGVAARVALIERHF